jgi:twitching motility protein PilU
MKLDSYLRLMVQQHASDLFLSVGAAPGIKVDGHMRSENREPMSAAQIDDIAADLMTPAQRAEFARSLEMNLAHDESDIGRFRINIYRQRGDIAIAIRYINSRIPGVEELNLPPVLKDLVMLPRGLVLIAGSVGSGKSTALASMIDYRNTQTTGHILTVEEPIEYLHSHKKSIVDQREVGLDTLSYANALQNAMREAPDVIVIGEIRDRETMEAALSYAQTGHLCLSTLHSSNASQALERIISFFPEDARSQVLFDLSMNLQAIVSLRLLDGENGQRVPAVEILLKTAYVSDLIAKGQVDLLKDAMKEATDSGMQSFDDALSGLYRDGRISYEGALSHADSRTDLQLRIRLSGDRPVDATQAEAEKMRLEPLSDATEPLDRGNWIGDSLDGRRQHEAEGKLRQTQAPVPARADWLRAPPA